MGKSKLRLDTRRALADGTYPIQIKVGYGTDIYLPTGIYLTESDWDSRTQMCIGKHARSINSILTTALTRITTRILELRDRGVFSEYNRAQLRQMLVDLTLEAPTIDSPTLGSYIDKVIAIKVGKTANTYKTVKVKLEKHCDLNKVHLCDMSAQWWNDWISAMDVDDLSHNTKHLYISAVKSVLRYAEDDGVPVNIAYKKVVSKMDTNTPMRNLPIEVLRKIRDEKVSTKSEMYRDAFLLSFYLIGINLKDLMDLPKNAVVNGRINYKRAKTGKHYSIKIEPEAQKILDKYPGKDKLLCFSEVKSFAVNQSYHLNKLLPNLTWYYARYSWANYAVDLDVPKDIISECLGHSHGAAVTGVYIRYTLDKIDKANRQVLDYFANNENGDK